MAHRSGSVITYHAALDVSSQSGYRWADFRDFRVDTGTRIVNAYTSGEHPDLPKPGRSMADVGRIRDLLRTAPHLVSAQLTVGDRACARFGIATRNPPPSPGEIRRLHSAIGTLHPLVAKLVATSSADSGTGTIAVALVDHAGAVQDLPRRRTLPAELAPFLRFHVPMTVRAAYTQGSIDVFTVSTKSAATLVVAASSGAGLGLDACTVN